MILTHDTTRLALAAAAFAAYAVTCAMPWLRWRRTHGQAGDGAMDGWIVAYASQTGNAEDLARQTANALRLAGVPARLLELSDLDAATLQGAERALFVASTYGEGDAPDGGAGFAGRLMTRTLPLAQLHYGVLALGDSSYAHFCGFGRALDGWLAAQGAQPLFPRVEVDRGRSSDIAPWRQHLSHLAGTSDAPDWEAPAFAPWRLAARRLMNPDSMGNPVYHIELEPASRALPAWESGDLAQVAPPGQPEQPREYSIASIPADGRVHLLVRLHRHADGTAGIASGWLCEQAAIGDTVPLRLRQHRRFRLGENADRPLILIGNGSGIAGLRGHLRARAAAGLARNWLLFGERQRVHDLHYGDELDELRSGGLLERLDLAFSRDEGGRVYVQDLLAPAADTLRTWVADGAAIYVCGSLEGMAEGVDRALRALLGDDAVAALADAGRYRRDVY